MGWWCTTHQPIITTFKYIRMLLSVTATLPQPTMHLSKCLGPCNAEPHPQWLCCCINILSHGLRCLCQGPGHFKQHFSHLHQVTSSSSVQNSVHSSVHANIGPWVQLLHRPLLYYPCMASFVFFNLQFNNELACSQKLNGETGLSIKHWFNFHRGRLVS